jgi:hypothetical protein
LNSEYEEDSSHSEEEASLRGSTSRVVPARRFFADISNLHWDGLGGYWEGKRENICFIDPNIGSDKSVLLVDFEWLLEYLAKYKLSLFWTVLGEKIIVTGNGHGGVLEFSRSHLLQTDGNILTSSFLFEKR